MQRVAGQRCARGRADTRTNTYTLTRARAHSRYYLSLQISLLLLLFISLLLFKSQLDHTGSPGTFSTLPECLGSSWNFNLSGRYALSSWIYWNKITVVRRKITFLQCFCLCLVFVKKLFVKQFTKFSTLKR